MGRFLLRVHCIGGLFVAKDAHDAGQIDALALFAPVGSGTGKGTGGGAVGGAGGWCNAIVGQNRQIILLEQKHHSMNAVVSDRRQLIFHQQIGHVQRSSKGSFQRSTGHFGTGSVVETVFGQGFEIVVPPLFAEHWTQ